jgi:hypothetical protein
MPLYVIRLEEVGWGCLLVAVTLVIHGLGMMITLRVANAIKDRFKESMSISLSLGISTTRRWTPAIFRSAGICSKACLQWRAANAGVVDRHSLHAG